MHSEIFSQKKEGGKGEREGGKRGRERGRKDRKKRGRRREKGRRKNKIPVACICVREQGHGTWYAAIRQMPSGPKQ